MSDLPETSCACAPIVLHIYKKFQVNRKKIKGGCQSETKAAHCYSCTDLTLGIKSFLTFIKWHHIFMELLSFESTYIWKFSKIIREVSIVDKRSYYWKSHHHHLLHVTLERSTKSRKVMLKKVAWQCFKLSVVVTTYSV